MSEMVRSSENTDNLMRRVMTVLKRGLGWYGRRPVISAGLAAMVLAITGVLLIGAIGLVAPASASFVNSGLPPVAPSTPANLHALTYFRRASSSVLARDKSCTPRLHPPFGQGKPDTGTPSHVILSTFGVLHRHVPRVPLPASGAFPGFYVNYVGVAQRRYGSVYEVAAVDTQPRLPRTSARCQALELTALQTLVRHIPKRLRVRALRVARDEVLDEQYIARNPEGVCLIGGGGAGCGPFLYAQARGSLQSTGYGADGSTFEYLVPNDVASITAHYPAEGPKQGFRRNLPALRVTQPVVNNLAVWRLAHEPGDVFPNTITWRSTTGKVLRTVYVG